MRPREWPLRHCYFPSPPAAPIDKDSFFPSLMPNTTFLSTLSSKFLYPEAFLDPFALISLLCFQDAMWLVYLSPLFYSFKVFITSSVHKILALGSAKTGSCPGAQSCTGKALHLQGLCKEQQLSMSRVTDLAQVTPRTLPGTEWTKLCGKILSQYIRVSKYINN